MQTLKRGNVGVMLDGDPAILYQFVGMYSCVIGLFKPLRGGSIVHRDITEFWPLLDGASLF
jgi:hypothetical protein